MSFIREIFDHPDSRINNFWILFGDFGARYIFPKRQRSELSNVHWSSGGIHARVQRFYWLVRHRHGNVL